MNSRELGSPVALVRADATASDVRISRAPMGQPPVDQPSLRSRPDEDAELKKLEQRKVEEARKRRANEANIKQKEAVTPPPQKPTQTKGKKAPPNPKLGNVDSPLNAPVANEDKAPAPQPQAPNPPPQEQQQVRGDSQIAPQVKK